MPEIPYLKGLNHLTFYYDEEKLHDKLEECGRRLSESTQYKLTVDSVLLDSFHSATIEGARTTIENVKRALKSPETKSDKMVVNIIHALDMIYSGSMITKENIRNLWEVVVKDVCENKGIAGTHYRAGDVYVSSLERIVHTPAPFHELSDYMNSLFAFLNSQEIEPLLKGILSHFYFVYVHPFCDGNGRTARILQNYCLFQGGYEGVRRIRISQAINMHLGAYYKVLEQVEQPQMQAGKAVLNLTAFIDYMLERIIEACSLAEKKQYSLSENEKRLLLRMTRKGLGAEITAAKASDMLGMTAADAVTLLNGLASKGYLLQEKQIDGKMLYRLLLLVTE